MIGKDSPTVSRAYAVNQDWFISVYDGNGYITSYDAEGYDRYGYDKDGVDREGIHENEYAYSENEGLYDAVELVWDYDGHKPVYCGQPKVVHTPKPMVTIEVDSLCQILDALRQVTHTFSDVGHLECDTIEKVYAAIKLIPSEMK